MPTLEEEIALIPERVAAGVEYLDGETSGWRAKVNLATLRMRNCSRCVAGQVYGDYWDRPHEPTTDPIGLGLMVPDWMGPASGVSPGVRGAYWNALDAEWVRVLSSPTKATQQEV